MGRPENVTIAGAGLVGSLLAVMLGQRGYRVRLYEQRPDMRKKAMAAGRSINLVLAERGIHALKQAGLMEQVEPLLVPVRGRMLHDREGNQEFWSYGQRAHEVNYSVSRGDLNRLLMTVAELAEPVDIEFEHELRGIDFAGKVMELRLGEAGATQATPFELLIGADGGGSRVRRCLIPHLEGEDRSEMLDHGYKELTLPAADDGGYRIEREALHIWPRGGFMLMALPNCDGSFTVTLFLRQQGEPSFEWLNSEDRVLQFFQQEFPDAVPLIPDLVEDFFKNPTGILGTVRCQPWSDGESVMLIGDAAHAVVPFHGQGMNAGFEDCSVLMEMLDRHREDWAAAMEAFSRTRKPDADAIADMALENYVVMRDSVTDPKFQLKKQLGFELERRWPDRFVPRYSLVMYHRVPYSEAYRRGAVEDQILERLVEGASEIEEVDWALAQQLVDERLEPLTAGSRGG